jgi:hypothetical protein
VNDAFAFFIISGNSVYGKAIDLIFWIIIGLFLFILLLDKFLDQNRKKSYSRFPDEFGEGFSGSSGGIYFGDGFKGLNRK